MYLVAFFLGYHLIRYFTNKYKIQPMKREQLDSVITWLIVGVLLGARLGYVFFYDFSYFMSQPWKIILPFNFEGGFHFTGISGMSYHGGLIGSFLLASYAIKKQKLDYWKTVNTIFLFVPLVYTFGRLGNFINGELYGTKTQSAIGMLFPHAPDFKFAVLRHPSQLYEMCFEGIVLFGILFALWKFLPKTRNHVMALYLIGYGIARYFIEFFREETHEPFISIMTRGQTLCALMILCGTALWIGRSKVIRR